MRLLRRTLRHYRVLRRALRETRPQALRAAWEFALWVRAGKDKADLAT